MNWIIFYTEFRICAILFKPDIAWTGLYWPFSLNESNHVLDKHADEMQLTNENVGGIAEVWIQSGHQGSWHMNKNKNKCFGIDVGFHAQNEWDYTNRKVYVMELTWTPGLTGVRGYIWNMVWP